MDDPNGPMDAQYARVILANYRAADKGGAACLDCISNIKGRCRILERLVDADHVCDEHLTERGAQVLLRRMRKILKEAENG